MPLSVRHAIAGMWLSLLTGQAFNLYQALGCEAGIDWRALGFAGFILACTLLVSLQIVTGREWARIAYLLLLVLSYALLAMDESGLTALDQWGVCLTAPVDLFVLVRLFNAHSTHWLLGDENAIGL